MSVQKSRDMYAKPRELFSQKIILENNPKPLKRKNAVLFACVDSRNVDLS